MVWPILISVSVIPGAFSARAGQAPVARAPAAAALEAKKVRRVFMKILPFRSQRRTSPPSLGSVRPRLQELETRATSLTKARIAPMAPAGIKAMIKISNTP